MSAWLFTRRERNAGVESWLALDSWRKVWRRRVSRRFLGWIMAMGLGLYGAIIYAITAGLMDSFRGLGLGETGAIWFGLCLYGSVVPVVAGILALSFRPLFAEPSEAVAAAPVSVTDWYGPQIRRYAWGVVAILAVTWTAVTLVLVQDLALRGVIGLTLEGVALGINAGAVGLLSMVVTQSVLGSRSWLDRLGLWGFVGLMAVAAVTVQSQQETGLKSLARFVEAHWLPTMAGAVVIGGLVGVTAVAVVRRGLARKGSVPLGLPTVTRLSGWRQRSLPMPKGLGLKIMVITLRGLAVDRKNAAMLVSSLVLFMVFGVAARVVHNPSLNSLVLGAAAVYVPLFLSLMMIFARSTLGKITGSIYSRPIDGWQVSGGQLLAVTVTSAAVTAGYLALLLVVVGNRIVPGELVDLAGNAAVAAAIAWLSGSLLRVNARDNLAILAGLVVMVVIQGGFYGAVSKFGDHVALARAFKLLVIVVLYAAGVMAEFGYSGRRWRRG